MLAPSYPYSQKTRIARSSAASVRADDGAESFGTYAASTAALRSYTRTWANELKDRDIRVNAVSPRTGTIDTPALSGVAPAEEVEAVRAEFAAKVPFRRAGTSEAAAVAFLASDQSSFAVGANLYVDGGENQL